METVSRFWFGCKVKYAKMQDDGCEKVVKEEYLVDAQSFTEAESRITEEMTPFISGEFDVATVKKNGAVELFYSDNQDADKFYQIKASFISIDEKSGKELKKGVMFYVKAADFDDAMVTFKNGMKDTMGDWELNAIVETAILDAYKYEEK